MKVEILKGYHLTSTHRNGIKQMILGGYTEGRMGRTDYFVQLQEDETYKVTIVSNERNMIGSDLKPTASYYILKIKI